jgi:hypothetical protein
VLFIVFICTWDGRPFAGRIDVLAIYLASREPGRTFRIGISSKAVDYSLLGAQGTCRAERRAPIGPFPGTRHARGPVKIGAQRDFRTM